MTVGEWRQQANPVITTWLALSRRNRRLMCIIKCARWGGGVSLALGDRESAFLSVYFQNDFFFPWVYQKETVEKEEELSFSPTRVTHILAPLHIHTRAQETFCFSATRQLWLLSSIFSPRLLFSPSICLSVRLSEENGSWWAASFLMTWLIWGRLACSFVCSCVCGCVCVYVCVISFSHSNSKKQKKHTLILTS